MAAEKMCKMHGKYADILRLRLGMWISEGVIYSWIQDRLRAGHGAEGVRGGK